MPSVAFDPNLAYSLLRAIAFAPMVQRGAEDAALREILDQADVDLRRAISVLLRSSNDERTISEYMELFDAMTKPAGDA